MNDALSRLLNLPARLQTWRLPDGNIAVSFEYTSIAEGGFLIGTFGVGVSFYDACENYLKKISGKTLVVESPFSTRREYNVL